VTPSVYVGVDFGGSTIRVGTMTPQGDRGAVLRARLDHSDSAREVIDNACAMIDAAVKRSGRALKAIGLAVTGPVDIETGLISNPWTLPSLTNVAIREPFEGRYQIPVVVENDADAAALGDFFYGCDETVSSLAMLTVGTGIGVALVRDGHLFRGASNYHQEAGHHAVTDDGPRCYCGIDGCWEQVASGTALERDAAAAIQDGRWTPGREIRNAVDVFAAGDDGDAFALDLIDRVAFLLGRGLRNLEAFYAPDKIVISGGLGQRFDLLAAGISRGRSPASSLSLHAPLSPSTLGDTAGIVGAACAARQLAPA
jgi:glucokinase